MVAGVCRPRGRSSSPARPGRWLGPRQGVRQPGRAAARAAGEAGPGAVANVEGEIFADLLRVRHGPGRGVRHRAARAGRSGQDDGSKAKYPTAGPAGDHGRSGQSAGPGGNAALEPAGLDTTNLPGRRRHRRSRGSVMIRWAAAPFRNLFGWTAAFAPGGTIDSLGRGSGTSISSGSGRYRTARLLTSAAVAAWEEIASIPDPQQREESRSELADRFLPAVVNGREEGTRAADRPAAPGYREFADRPDPAADPVVPRGHGALMTVQPMRFLVSVDEQWQVTVTCPALPRLTGPSLRDAQAARRGRRLLPARPRGRS